MNHYDKAGRLHRQIATDARSSYQYYRRGLGTGLVRRISSKTAQVRVSKTFHCDQRGRTTEELWSIRADGDSHEHTIAYTYEGTAVVKAGQLETASHKWSAISGTGSFKGIKAAGTCTGIGKPDGSAQFECTGDYTIPK